MIPADLATRLRVLIDSEVKSLVPIQQTPADLPDLEAGQRFTARIDSPLADGTFRALVAGRTVTLAMSDSAKAGDVLELVVTGKQDGTITAKVADAAIPLSTASQPRLSAAGQLISQLLTGRHGETQAATLNRNEPLLSAPPAKGALLTPLLRQAVSESGLFYEAHQAQWVEGEASLESLLREPQARGSPAPAQSLPPGAQTAGQGLSPDSSDHQTPQSLLAKTPAGQLPGDGNAAARNAAFQAGHETEILRTSAADGAPAPQSGALKIAEQLMPIVHQQLDTLATHQAIWQGQVWPGQTMQWQIFDPEGQQSSSEQSDGGGEPAPWQSTLRLQMPRLGGIEAQLIITAAGVAVRVRADSAQAAEQLLNGSSALGSALEAAGVPMTGFVVDREARI